jgi:hypothetical protein
VYFILMALINEIEKEVDFMRRPKRCIIIIVFDGWTKMDGRRGSDEVAYLKNINCF